MRKICNLGTDMATVQKITSKILSMIASTTIMAGCFTTVESCDCDPQDNLKMQGGLIDVIEESSSETQHQEVENTETANEGKESSDTDSVDNEDPKQQELEMDLVKADHLGQSESSDLNDQGTPKLEVFTTDEGKTIDADTSASETDDYIKESEHVSNSALTKTPLYQVAVSHLNVRSGPSMQHEVVGVVSEGDVLQALGREGIWVMIDQNQYVSISFLKELKGSQSH